jgi:hypothetical protein
MDTLNVNQKKALREYLKPGARTAADVAEAIGLTERTIHEYMQCEEFRRFLHAGLDRSISQANIQLTHLSILAINTLRELLKSDKTSDTNKRLSAQVVLDNLYKIKEVSEFAERLSKLERKIMENEKT